MTCMSTWEHCRQRKLILFSSVSQNTTRSIWTWARYPRLALIFFFSIPPKAKGIWTPLSLCSVPQKAACNELALRSWPEARDSRWSRSNEAVIGWSTDWRRRSSALSRRACRLAPSQRRRTDIWARPSDEDRPPRLRTSPSVGDPGTCIHASHFWHCPHRMYTAVRYS